jgi:threonylcarbamoyladenosine tRNA methylthiotransferase MtaB
MIVCNAGLNTHDGRSNASFSYPPFPLPCFTAPRNQNKREKRVQDLTFAVLNHGCKLNQYEGEAVAQGFIDAGFRAVQWTVTAPPDVAIVNTCTVTEKSDRKSRHTIHKSSRYKPKGGILVVTGCYAETNPEELSKIDGVDLVVGAKEKPRIVDLVKSRFEKVPIHFKSPASPFCYKDPEYTQRSRAFVKVQDGCDMRCAYCKVPLARGRSVSRDSNEIVTSVARAVTNGYSEVVLTGINIGDYRYGGKRLLHLITLLLKSTGDIRIRLSSVEPAFFEKGLFDIMGEERVTPHFHIPLQSGSDRILKLMNRSYTVNDYMEIVEGIKRVRPESHLATDLIIGFPTENETDFNSTVDLVESVQFASVHVFRYSSRTGTSGAKLPDNVAYEVKSRRSKKLIELGRRLNREYRARFIGRQRKTVLEAHGNVLRGVTDNYIRVTIEGKEQLAREQVPRRLVSALITRIEDDVTYARIPQSPAG